MSVRTWRSPLAACWVFRRRRDPAVRRRIAAVLDRDPQAARRSVRTELARHRGPTPAPIDDAADPLEALWAGYPVDALETLADRDPRFAHVVAAAAVAPRPAIRSDVAAVLAANVRRDVGGFVGGDDEGMTPRPDAR